MFEVIEQTIPNEMHVEHPLPTGFLVALCQTLFELYPSTLTQVCNNVSYNLMDKIFWSLIFGSVVFPVCCLFWSQRNIFLTCQSILCTHSEGASSDQILQEAISMSLQLSQELGGHLLMQKNWEHGKNIMQRGPSNLVCHQNYHQIGTSLSNLGWLEHLPWK